VKLFRKYPQLLDAFLPKALPSFFLTDEKDSAYSKEVMNLPHAQAVIPGGSLDRGLSGDSPQVNA
jgi:hypothetical protein